MMSFDLRYNRRADSVHQIPNNFRDGLCVLAEAAKYAEETNCDIWDFSVLIGCLERVGWNPADLRWLVKKGIIEHACEVTEFADDHRVFRRTGELAFFERTCFVITDLGTRLASEICVVNGDHASISVNPGGPVTRRPKWYPDKKELWLMGAIVRRYKWQAVNQERVLSAFEEDGWPSVIDDPLPPKAEQDPKRRLHDTIKALNRYQAAIRFHGNGTGEGIRWELPNGRRR